MRGTLSRTAGKQSRVGVDGGVIGSSLVRIRTDTDIYIGIVREGEVVEIDVRDMFSPVDIITLM